MWWMIRKKSNTFSFSFTTNLIFFMGQDPLEKNYITPPSNTTSKFPFRIFFFFCEFYEFETTKKLCRHDFCVQDKIYVTIQKFDMCAKHTRYFDEIFPKQFLHSRIVLLNIVRMGSCSIFAFCEAH